VLSEQQVEQVHAWGTQTPPIRHARLSTLMLPDDDDDDDDDDDV
jgi:hypothetical protein